MEEAEMNKTDMITAVAGKNCMTKKNAEKAINAVFEVISDSLAQGDKVRPRKKNEVIL